MPDHDWAQLVAESQVKDARSAVASWTRPWNQNANLIGNAGEWGFEAVSGIPRHRAFGDGGRDFADIDAKGCGQFDTPRLRWPLSDRLVASYFALVAVDERRHLTRYDGWATRAEMSAAPLIDLGYGPSYTLTPEQLHRAFPPLIRVVLPA